jgi:hypothetical protein
MRTATRLTVLLLGGITILCASLPAQPLPKGPEGDERELFDAANRERAARHLSPLRWDEKLARAARDHAVLMARMGAISHQFPGEPGLSSRVSRAGVHSAFVAENVGDAEDAAELQDAWMQSPGHRANLLEQKVDAVGIAVVRGGVLLYAVEDFARMGASLSLEEQEKQVGALLQARGLRLLETTSEVRQTCLLARGVAPGLHPKYLFRYLTADLGELPRQLQDELERHNYQSAAVGACASSGPAPSGGYRIAILLF